MANPRSSIAVFVIAVLTMLVGGTGLYLGFQQGRTPKSGPAVPHQPDQGPILYDMRSIQSEPDRIRLEWALMDDAREYRITVLSAADESLFTSPMLTANSWVIPPSLRSRLEPATVYHWKVNVVTKRGDARASDPAAFATQ